MLSANKLKRVRGKYGSIGKWQAARKERGKRILSVSMAFVIVIGIFGAVGKLFRKDLSTGSYLSGLIVQSHALGVAIPKMEATGWSPSMYNVNENVDPSKDTSYRGTQAFLPYGSERIGSIDDAIALVSNGTWAAEAIIIANEKATGCTRAEYLDKANWILFQSNVPFHYKQMTAWSNNQIVTTLEARKGNPGDVFAAFVAPRSDAMTFLRGACGNISLLIPTPDEPATTTIPWISTTKREDETTTEATTEATTGESTTGEESTTAAESTSGESTTGSTSVVTTATTAASTKDPSEDPNNNTSIPTWIHDGSETTHSIVMDTSGTNHNYLQIDPEAAAAAAEKAAQAIIDAANAALAKAIEDAKTTGAGVVDSNEEHVAVTSPPNW